LADDVQDEESTLTWTVDEGNLVAFDNILVDWSQNGQDVTRAMAKNEKTNQKQPTKIKTQTLHTLQGSSRVH
jgi:hypothetical protein